jgi:hypothetical protein
MPDAERAPGAVLERNCTNNNRKTNSSWRRPNSRMILKAGFTAAWRGDSQSNFALQERHDR